LRIREPGEVEPPAQKETILKRSCFVKVKCGFYGIKGHNVRGCHKAKVAGAASSQPQSQMPTAQASSQSNQAKRTTTTSKDAQKTTSKKGPQPQSQKPAAPKSTARKRPQSQSQVSKPTEVKISL
jgi:hypothetical protein